MKIGKISMLVLMTLIIIGGAAVVGASNLSDHIGDIDSAHIQQACFYTGDDLSDKTYASFYVGRQYANEDVKIQIFYSRDGTLLNDGNIVPKTITPDGFIDVRSADSYKSFPDFAEITIYDVDGIELDHQTVSLSPSSGVQAFDLEVYGDGNHPPNPTQEIEQHFNEYVKNN